MSKKLRFLFALCIATSTASAQNLPAYVPFNSITAWWPFSGNAGDSSGNGNHGSVAGATLAADRAGVTNRAYHFTSAACSPHIRANIYTLETNTGLTIAFWARRTGTGCISPRMFEFTDDTMSTVTTPGNVQWAWSDNAGLHFETSTANGTFVQASLTSPQNNVWTHFAYTNNGQTAQLYKDASLVSTVSTSGTPKLGKYGAIGRMNHPNYDAFNGDVDDMGVWGRALTSCEIRQLYIGASSVPVIQFSNGLLTVVGGPFTAYQWYLNGNAINGATSSTYTPTTNGTYTVTTTASGGCSATSPTKPVTGLGIATTANTLGSQVRISPNPATDVVRVEWQGSDGPDGTVCVYNAVGQAVYSGVWKDKTTPVELSSFAPGVYILELTQHTGETYRHRIAKH